MICFHLVPSLARKSTDKFPPLRGQFSPKWNGQDEKTEDSGVEPLKADSLSITQYIQCTNTSVYPAGCQGRSLIQHSPSTPVCQLAKKNRWYWSYSIWQRFLPSCERPPRETKSTATATASCGWDHGCLRFSITANFKIILSTDCYYTKIMPMTCCTLRLEENMLQGFEGALSRHWSSDPSLSFTWTAWGSMTLACNHHRPVHITLKQFTYWFQPDC